MEAKKPDLELDNKRIKIIEYINTVILTIIGISSTIIFVMLSNVRQSQEETAKELIRLKTVQEMNVSAVKGLTDRVQNLELSYLEYIKNWVDENYIRKPQK